MRLRLGGCCGALFPSVKAYPARGPAKARNNIWPRQEILDGLRAAARELPAGQPLTQDQLIEKAVGRSDIPSLQVVQRLMKEERLSFSEIKALAATQSK